MTEPDAELIALFRDEASERLDQMDTALLAIESGTAGPDTTDALFRNAHTIKGAAGMLGFDDVQRLARAAEDILASVRDAGLFPPDLAAPLLQATSAMRAHVNGAGEPIGSLLDELAASRPARPDGQARSEPSSAPGAGAPESRRTP